MPMVTYNPYIPSDDIVYNTVPSHANPYVINESTYYALAAEAVALERKNFPSTLDAIWTAEVFSMDIYCKFRDNMSCLPKLELDALMLAKDMATAN
ncbi:hypothetical protein BD770DRAFT_438986 [Pilaira anomala]|nr:hypothetical protein BD770DRAFT_438986 [Pilaira anomala]